MNKKFTNELINKYWFFKPDPTLRNNLMAFGFECGDGWYELISELCYKIDKLITDKYPDLKKVEPYNYGYPTFYVTQVKEKFGGLRFYVTVAYDEIFDLIDEYEEKSLTICEYCGKMGELRNKNNWLATLCDEHYTHWLEKGNLWSLNT